MSSEVKNVGKTANENANLIWHVADSLRGPYKPHEYGLVILPMCVIKRFHDCLLPYHDDIIAANKKFGHMGTLKAGFLKRASHFDFYNTSKFTFEKLKTDPENIEENFRDYLHGFSDNVTEILTRMNFFAQVDRMVEAKVLYQVIIDFSADDLDMSPARITTVDMGYIFENLVQRFSESYEEEAGAHFTSRDIIYLMCDLLLVNSNVFNDDDGLHCTVYDMTMGTSQMLTCMEERLKQLDSRADVKTFGQEINPFTMGIAVADTLIHGGDPDNMQFGDTLSDDKFEGYKFDFVISNPPFGIDWKREANEVEKEHKRGEAGRFAPGLPGKSDGQMLFLLNGISKLKDGSGKMAIIQNGSSLSGGDAGSGQSEIRRYIIENEWLDAIVQLPKDSFYNTGILTYVWIIDKAKPFRNPGQILLIDASECCESRFKPIGNKRVDITQICRELIVQAYDNYETAEYKSTMNNVHYIICKSSVVDSCDLGYTKVTVETPSVDADGNAVLKKGKKVPDTSKRDTEKIPLSEDIKEYFEREVIPYNSEAWIDEKKDKVGYEINMKQYFYHYQPIEPSKDILERIEVLESNIAASLRNLLQREE